MKALVARALFLVALVSSAWAWWLIAWPVLVLDASPRHTGHFGFVYVHTLTGTAMLFMGAAALYIGWTRRQFRYHKLFGYTYLSAGVVGAGLAFVLALAGRH